MLLSLSLSLLIFDLFHKLGLWSSCPLKKTTDLHTFSSDAFERFYGMSFESAAAAVRKTSSNWFAHRIHLWDITLLSLSLSLTHSFCLNIMNTKMCIYIFKQKDKKKILITFTYSNCIYFCLA